MLTTTDRVAARIRMPLTGKLQEFATVADAYSYVLRERPEPPFHCRVKGYSSTFRFCKHDAQSGSSKWQGWIHTTVLSSTCEPQ